ncbi:hypothetical protein M436DRAFT_65175 [Aureobasidium namibiae CBS 147.97]|uniref:Uncharacterized protein n=1 Tax=Aureobasidium namibiae CBS 147.97 TaxID=1043004 RepID=A0A074WJA8_9PEZI|nr:uncharacterized protein M436DRAFT_65175 [Aureobasidium namibiae CBS 147.97]KEQ71689.1 hypothetical protein M436DRAFT_65175 [Aureobasidium namibiae CBS 147.97]
MTTTRNHPKDSLPKDSPRRSSRIKTEGPRYTKRVHNSARSPQREESHSPLHRWKDEENAKVLKVEQEKTRVGDLETLVSASSCSTKGTPLTSHIDCQGHPAEDFSHLYNELQDLKRRYPRWGKEHAELYFGAVRGIPTFLDQRRSDALMQDALLRLDSIAGSKKDVQMFIAHWKAAAPLAQRLTSQRQFDLHYYLTLPVGRA